MTTNEITSTARRKVLETTIDIVADDIVLLYANQAYIEVYKRAFTGNKITSSSIACSAGVCTLPADYGRMYTTGQDTDGNLYEEVSVADFLKTENTDVFTIEAGALKIKNIKITALAIKYYAQPAALTASQNPTIDSYFHECIVYGTIWRIHEDLQDEELATYYQEKFEKEFTRRLAMQSSYEESNQSGGEMFTYQRLI